MGFILSAASISIAPSSTAVYENGSFRLSLTPDLLDPSL